ncbi:MAG: hypothetical protein U0794_20480 [Isosphaeraceae bacterium]
MLPPNNPVDHPQLRCTRPLVILDVAHHCAGGRQATPPDLLDTLNASARPTLGMDDFQEELPLASQVSSKPLETTLLGISSILTKN